MQIRVGGDVALDRLVALLPPGVPSRSRRVMSRFFGQIQVITVPLLGGSDPGLAEVHSKGGRVFRPGFDL